MTLFPTDKDKDGLADLAKLMARLQDPSTSKQAAEEHVISGEYHRDLDEVFDALKKHPGLTARELARDAGLPADMVWKRLSDLKRDNKAFASEVLKRRCTVTRKVARVWYAGGIQAQLQEAA